MNRRTEKMIEQLRKIFEKNALQIDAVEEGIYMLLFKLKSETSDIMDSFLISWDRSYPNTDCLNKYPYNGYIRTSPVTLQMNIPYPDTGAVRGKSFLEMEKDEKWQTDNGEIPLLLGCRNDNSSMIVDLAQNECLVICNERLPLIRTMLAGLLPRFSPADLRIAVCWDRDKEFPDFPHLLTSPILSSQGEENKECRQLLDFLQQEIKFRFTQWKSHKPHQEVKRPAIVVFFLGNNCNLAQLLYLMNCGPQVGIYTILHDCCKTADGWVVLRDIKEIHMADKLIGHNDDYSRRVMAEDDMLLEKTSGESLRFLAGRTSVDDIEEILKRMDFSMPHEEIDVRFLNHRRQFMANSSN